MLRFIVRVIVNAVALAAAAWIIPGISVGSSAASQATGNDSAGTVVAYLFIGLIFGIVNAVVRPIISFLSVPITCLTLGLFAIVINAAMLLLTSWLSSYTPIGLHVDTFFWDAVLGSLIISIVSALIGWVVPDRHDR
ncbi:MAG: phage holin family protein [Arthrobacter sp.]|uniref:phage holin family protein n=1 Tax=unclassified Arthrobacter TaxID=235627 RepID=UPI00264D48CB|nr:phage holin family protein [Micrococcaceae bacterium]MDN5811709.1 phage holin family protein [Micrococcaceae bacterium]MDN5822920.1 phage holin family protein [Micrococcaceae bacterium]MDN5878660.1 phage holin family protein [Micrococcaceae bacterium]MDN5886184.1 phage holin family protein [Micrococcaceae bacterium]